MAVLTARAPAGSRCKPPMRVTAWWKQCLHTAWSPQPTPTTTWVAWMLLSRRKPCSLLLKKVEHALRRPSGRSRAPTIHPSRRCATDTCLHARHLHILRRGHRSHVDVYLDAADNARLHMCFRSVDQALQCIGELGLCGAMARR